VIRGREPVADESDVRGREEGAVLHGRRHVLGEDSEGADRHPKEAVVGHEGVRLLTEGGGSCMV